MVANEFLSCFATLPGFLLNKHFLNVEQVIRSYGEPRSNAQCPNCGKLYKYKFNLNRHIRYECGVAKQFRCAECGRSFSQKSSLKSHRGIVHGVIWYLKRICFLPKTKIAVRIVQKIHKWNYVSGCWTRWASIFITFKSWVLNNCLQLKAISKLWYIYVFT